MLLQEFQVHPTHHTITYGGSSGEYKGGRSYGSGGGYGSGHYGGGGGGYGGGLGDGGYRG